jgi:glutathionylspermidine synthase
MYRQTTTPREGFQETIASQGLVFYDTPQPDGRITKYWPEDAYYEFNDDEVVHLEGVTANLYLMCIEAARFMASGEMGNLGLTNGALHRIRESLESDPVSIYARFDLNFDGLGPAKMFEINGDTPTGLVESSVVQYYWLQDKFPYLDQWNSLHERLVDAWKSASSRLPAGPVHFAHYEGPPEHADAMSEEWMTIAYMRDCATQAGLDTIGLSIEDIGWDSAERRFKNATLLDAWKNGQNVDIEPITSCFKLYPWENMIDPSREEFGKHILDGTSDTVWIEPIWKTMLSNKAILAALWHLYPNHENLLPAYLGEPPSSMIEWIRKPLHGREGDGMAWETIKHGSGESPTHVWGSEGYCYQEFKELTELGDGYRPVCGTWVVDGKPAGLGIRESRALVTDNLSRFIPHVMTEPAPTEAEIIERRSRDDETFRATKPELTF